MSRKRGRRRSGAGADLAPFRRPARRAAGRQERFWLWAALAWGLVALFGTALGAGWLAFPAAQEAEAPARTASPASAEPGVRSRFSFCHVGAGTYCVVDGDTFWFAGEKIRIADIDAPETHDYRCASEKALGNRATRRLRDLLESGPITLESIDRDADVYGRRLRIVRVGGWSVGNQLVSEGLARPYAGGRRPWC